VECLEGANALAKQVLSQLSYTPTVGVTFILKHLASFRIPILRNIVITVRELCLCHCARYCAKWPFHLICFVNSNRVCSPGTNCMKTARSWYREARLQIFWSELQSKKIRTPR